MTEGPDHDQPAIFGFRHSDFLRVSTFGLRHLIFNQDLGPAAAAALTAFCAASARSSAGIKVTPLSFRSRFPFSTFVPSILTTTGTESFSVFAALMLPLAITSTFILPPQLFTIIALP